MSVKIVPEPICPMTPNGNHERHPWALDGRSGFACRRCHKTWTHVSWWPAALPTYDIPEYRAVLEGPRP